MLLIEFVATALGSGGLSVAANAGLQLLRDRAAAKAKSEEIEIVDEQAERDDGREFARLLIERINELEERLDQQDANFGKQLADERMACASALQMQESELRKLRVEVSRLALQNADQERSLTAARKQAAALAEELDELRREITLGGRRG